MATKKTEVVSKPKKTSKKKKENPMLSMAETFRDAYEAFKEVGFTEEQAYDLLMTAIMSPAAAPPKTSLF